MIYNDVAIPSDMLCKIITNPDLHFSGLEK